MATGTGLLLDGFSRVHDVVDRVVDGLSVEQLGVRLDHEANSMAWLIWHLTRIQDDHVSELADAEQSWTADGWASEFGLPFSPHATGYAHTTEEVQELSGITAKQLLGYFDAVNSRTVAFVEPLSETDLDRVIDRRWNPPVTLGVRLVSVIADDLQHAGQAAFIAGIVKRR